MDTEKLSELFSWENQVKKAINNMNSNDPSINEAYITFCNAYNFIMLSYPSIINKYTFNSTSQYSKELIQYKNTNNYFSKNQIRLVQNLQILLSIIYRIKLSYTSSPDFFISSLILSNYRMVGSNPVSYSFSKGINLIVGNNGTGKTSILDAVSYCLARYIKAMSFSTKKLDSIEKNEKTGTHIEAMFNYYDNPLTEIIDYYDLNEKYTTSDEHDTLFLLGKTQINNTDLGRYIPVIAYYCIATGTNDHQYKKEIPKHLQGYIGCLNGGASIKETKKWLRTANDELINRFLSVVNSFLCSMEEGNLTKKIVWDSKKAELYYSDMNATIPFENLSSGYKQLIHLIVDLTFRVISLNPFISSLDLVSGIVLIDEIDLHLHPRWQWNVLPALSKAFNNIQFIITTHSPFVVSSCDSDRILVISNNHQRYVGKQYGSSIQTIAELVLGSRSIPKKLFQLFTEFQKALQRENYELAESYLEQIKKEYGEDNDIFKEAKWSYELDFDEETNS